MPSKSLTEIKLDNEIETFLVKNNFKKIKLKKLASFCFLRPKIEPC